MKRSNAIEGLMGGLRHNAEEEKGRFPDNLSAMCDAIRRDKANRGSHMVDKMDIMFTYEELIETIEDEELKDLIEAQRSVVRGRPKVTDDRDPLLWTQFTAAGRTEYLEKVKEISRTESVMIKDIIDVALKNYLKAYEKKHGPVKVQDRKNPRSADELI